MQTIFKLGILIGIVYLVTLFLSTTTKATHEYQTLTQSQLSVTQPINATQVNTWDVYLSVNPINKNDVNLTIANATTACQAVELITNPPVSPAPTVTYDETMGIYRATIIDLFPQSFLIEDAQLQAKCQLNNGSQLETDIVRLRRYQVDESQNTDLTHFNGLAELALFDDSLNVDSSIIVMDTNGLPAPLPNDVQVVGQAYTFNVQNNLTQSQAGMTLSLGYFSDQLGTVDSRTLRIFQWDEANGQWLNKADQINIVTLNQVTTDFTTYVIGSTPLWTDDFFTQSNLDEPINIRQTGLDGGKLFLSEGQQNGSAMSLPYMPTLALRNWHTVSYTARVIDGQQLTVSVLSSQGEVIKSAVESGETLLDIDPTRYPSLRLKVDMATTTTSPELLNWSLLAEIDTGPPPLFSTTLNITDETGQPISETLIYNNGELVTDANGNPVTSNQQGQLTITVGLSDTLAALKLGENFSQNRNNGVNQPSYQVYYTSTSLDNQGNINATTATRAYETPISLTLQQSPFKIGRAHV